VISNADSAALVIQNVMYCVIGCEQNVIHYVHMY